MTFVDTNSAASGIEESTDTMAAMVGVVRRKTAASSADTTETRCGLNVQCSVVPTHDETTSLVQKDASVTITRKKTGWLRKMLNRMSQPSRRKAFTKNTSARSEKVATSGIAATKEVSVF